MKIRVVKRVLRHKNPVIILPYILNTREEELANKMCYYLKSKRTYTIHTKDIDRIKDL